MIEVAKAMAKDWLAERLKHLALHPKDIVIGVQVLREGEKTGAHYIVAHVNGPQFLKMTGDNIVKRALTIKIGDGAMISINF